MFKIRCQECCVKESLTSLSNGQSCINHWNILILSPSLSGQNLSYCSRLSGVIISEWLLIKWMAYFGALLSLSATIQFSLKLQKNKKAEQNNTKSHSLLRWKTESMVNSHGWKLISFHWFSAHHPGSPIVMIKNSLPSKSILVMKTWSSRNYTFCDILLKLTLQLLENTKTM